MKNILIIASCVLAFASCKKFENIAPPKNQLESSKVFADSLNANSAVVGIYIDMMKSFGFTFSSGGLTAYPGMAADELSQSSADPELAQLYTNSIAIQNKYNLNLWTSAYKYIYDANSCVEGISESKGISPYAKGQLSAEARQIRAFLFFNLVNLYGPAPLVMTTNYHVNQTLPRASVDSIYAQITNDLTYAKANLSKDISPERAGYYSATALLAKVQLYRKRYNDAIASATEVINSGKYHLENDLNNVFLAGSYETIWKIVPVVPGFETWEAYSFVPSKPTAAPKYLINNALYNAFEPGDMRKQKWISSNTISGTIYPYPYKYKAARDLGTSNENYTILRLAELYLIRAEARANLNDLPGAQSDINLIRNRAGLPNTNANDRASILLAVERERRTEMFCEWGNRWFDLQRTNRADAVLPSLKPGWDHNDGLFPIPAVEIKSNPALTQNHGY
ncbi:RagB/SusD family nutrient uptake outer membrane protein [Mucilaginibacter sp. RCC_168]|uniref:RagB/SusD family nutrient uptake outer membrane protein n=1 Tax=Mucilaginibacter sp. RCC_168 TaxID=3239221 RepID=UPI00352536E3